MPGTTKEIQGVIQWDGKGNYTQNADVTLAGKTGSGSVTGTYTVDSNGRFSRLYKGFVAALRQAFLNQLCFPGDLKNLAQPQAFAGWLRPFHRQDWLVYLKHRWWLFKVAAHRRLDRRNLSGRDCCWAD